MDDTNRKIRFVIQRWVPKTLRGYPLKGLSSGPDWAEAMRNGCIPIHVLPEQCTRDDELLPSNCCLADIVRRRDMLWSGHLVLQVVDGPILCLLYGSYSGSRGWWCTCV